MENAIYNLFITKSNIFIFLKSVFFCIANAHMRHSKSIYKNQKHVAALIGDALGELGSKLKYIGNDTAKSALGQEEEEEGAVANGNGEQNEYDPKALRILNIRETRFMAAGFAVFGYLLNFAYISFILINMNYTYDYTQMRLSNSPGPFNNARYGFPWAIHYAMYFNLLSPITLLAAVGEIQHRSRLRLNKAINWLLVLVNIVAFFSLAGIWIVYCDNGWSFGSPCDDPANCCVNYGSSQGITYCPVTAGCTYVTSWSQLTRWTPFFLSFLWSLFFGLYVFFSFSVNDALRDTFKRARDYQTLLEEDEKDDEAVAGSTTAIVDGGGGQSGNTKKDL
jgi:hypothetical protein